MLAQRAAQRLAVAATVACRREGATSVACMEPEWSIASTMLACSAGTATLTCGRASAASSPASASKPSAGGRCRRQPGRRGSTEAAVAGDANARSRRRRRRSANP